MSELVCVAVPIDKACMVLRPLEGIFVQSRHYRAWTGSSVRPITHVVLHGVSVSGPDNTKSLSQHLAAQLAADQSPKASFHYCVDATGVVGCVKDLDVAFHAHKFNRTTLGVALVWGRDGYVARDTKTPRLLLNAAGLVAALCLAHGLTPAYAPESELIAGARGITTHTDVGVAFRGDRARCIPIEFPIIEFVKLVSATFGTLQRMPLRRK